MRKRILTDKERKEHTREVRQRYYKKNKKLMLKKSAMYYNKRTADKNRKEIQKLRDLIKELKAKPKKQPKPEKQIFNSANAKTWFSALMTEIKVWKDETEKVFDKVPESEDFKKGREEGIQKTIDMMYFLMNDKRERWQTKTIKHPSKRIEKKASSNPYGLKRRGAIR